MDELFQQSTKLIVRAPTTHERPLLNSINANARFVGIRGTRGVGKTTLLLQFARRQLRDLASYQVLYVSLESLYFRNHTLYEFGKSFVREGGKVLLLDEVHRYPDWAVEVKLLFDNFPELRLLFTSSSIVEITRAKADLSRRVLVYDLYGLSFREYLRWNGIADLPVHSLDDMLRHAPELLATYADPDFVPLRYLRQYWVSGYYPYAQNDPELYGYFVNAGINTLLDNDIPAVYLMMPSTSEKLKRLLLVIGESVPFKPNITKLAGYLSVNRETVLNYLYYLHQARLIALLPGQVRGIIRTQKPEKIYLDNPNLLYALPGITPNIGTVRETFVYNALSTAGIDVGYGKTGDFQTDNYTFEVGGPNKGNKQLTGTTNGYRVLDDITEAWGNVIPIWLLGLLR